MQHAHSVSLVERGQRKGRRLFDTVRLLGPHEEAATYWELFSDLLLVAAASSLAEILEEEADFTGWLKFALLYVITVNGWFLYTHHYTARFDDSSLVHSFLLFFYYHIWGWQGPLSMPISNPTRDFLIQSSFNDSLSLLSCSLWPTASQRQATASHCW